MCAVATLALGCGEGPSARSPAILHATQSSVCATTVTAFEPQGDARYGHDRMPDVVLGPPRGKGEQGGSLDVVSLGRGGSVTLGFGDFELVDGDGPDFLVFENAFLGWVEPGEVSVSQDGVSWLTLKCLPVAPDYSGCAGVRPVFSSIDNAIAPDDAQNAGGDAFDLAAVGVTWARLVKITDSNLEQSLPGPGEGFDLDAICAVHARRIR